MVQWAVFCAVARFDMRWFVQPSVRDARAGGVAPRPGHHRHQGLCGPRGTLRIHANQTGRMVSIVM